jgi:predicted nucleotidyltransferase component of viral defense system
MFDKQTFTREWIETSSKQNRNADKILVEKVIQSLALLSSLNSSGLPFIFKGGTALMLMLNKPSRFSIDIDIIIQDKNEDLEKIFNKIIESGIFIKYTKQER